MKKENTYTNNIIITLFDGRKKIQTAVMPAAEIQKHQGKIISFLMKQYRPTSFEMRLELDETSDYPRYYFGQTALCDNTGKPQVICKGKAYPLKKTDYVFDPATMKCTYGQSRLVSVSTHLPKSLLRVKLKTSALERS